MMKIPQSYEALVRQIYQINLYNPAKLGLQNIQRLNDILGRPSECFQTIHIAGTNGKGSVAWKIAKGLEVSGHHTGLFVSPHISSFRERMQVNGKLISEKAVEDLLPEILWACERHDIPATFFELTTALAFSHFAKEKVDTVVLEAGLGGRMDATNIILPMLSIITSIGLEHTRILGNTIEEIAREKAGIMKPGVPVLLGSQTPTKVLVECSKISNSPIYFSRDFQPQPHLCERDAAWFSSQTCLDYDLENSHTAHCALQILGDLKCTKPISQDGIIAASNTRPPCRFEFLDIQYQNRSIPVILDVAHNPDAISRLFYKLRESHPNKKYRVIVGMSSDKDAATCLQTIFDNTTEDRIHFVQAAHPRSTPVSALLDSSSQIGHHVPLQHQIIEQDNVKEVVWQTLPMVKNEEELLVICGSVFLMADAREALGLKEPRDSKFIEEVAGAHLRAAQDNLVPDQAKTAASLH
mmetsp:Transcript_27809/g.34811  ORF Transcript_27809/g.34811 Transcript_27809/m.34811 type:complete len:468 (-) Transcript_27809:135-1538(-)